VIGIGGDPDEQLLLLVPVGLDALPVLVLAHLLPSLLDHRTHAGTPHLSKLGPNRRVPDQAIRIAKDRNERKHCDNSLVSARR
jgi:hypothetical protein